MAAHFLVMRLRGQAPGGAPKTEIAPSFAPAAMRFLAASGLSYTGDWLTTVAISVTLYALLGAWGPAAYIVARVVPRPLGSWIGGRLTDLIGPQLVLAGLTTAQALCGVVLIFAMLQSIPALVLATVAVAQLCGAGVVPARMTAITRLGGSAGVARLSAWHGTLASASVILAPALGAALLLVLPAAAVIGIDVVTFIVAVPLLATLRLGRVGQQKPVGVRPRAWRVLLADSQLLRFAAGCFTNFALITALQAALVVVAYARFGSGATVGLLYTAVGAGSIAGGLIAMHRPPRGLAMSATAVLEIVAVLAFTLPASLPLSALCLAICGGAGAAFQVGGSILIAERVAPETTGAVSGEVATAGYVGMMAGAALGFLGAAAGSLVAIQAVGAVSLVISFLVAAPRSGSRINSFRGRRVTMSPTPLNEAGIGISASSRG